MLIPLPYRWGLPNLSHYRYQGMTFSNLGTTANALSMNVLDMVILVKGNYDGSERFRPLPSPFKLVNHPYSVR